MIDYSLLLIIDQKRTLLRMGIIDFMRPYHFTEKLESFYKEIKSGGAVPTVIPPVDYSQRFMDAMNHYFLKINSD